jgi:hypothetical protein
MSRSPLVDLAPEPANEDVDRAVSVAGPSAPDLLQELVACHDPAGLERQRIQESKFGRSQLT